LHSSIYFGANVKRADMHVAWRRRGDGKADYATEKRN
jgi:hypothetical protein